MKCKIPAQLISVPKMMLEFFNVAEQVTGKNPATILQKTNKRPVSEDAYYLCFLKGFSEGPSDMLDLKYLRSMYNVSMLCCGPEMEMYDLLSLPSTLQTLQVYDNNRAQLDILPAIWSGNMSEWNEAIVQGSVNKDSSVHRSWAAACYMQFLKYNLNFLLDLEKPTKIEQGFLTY